jgi:regulator of replication initiation timing
MFASRDGTICPLPMLLLLAGLFMATAEVKSELLQDSAAGTACAHAGDTILQQQIEALREENELLKAENTELRLRESRPAESQLKAMPVEQQTDETRLMESTEQGCNKKKYTIQYKSGSHCGPNTGPCSPKYGAGYCHNCCQNKCWLPTNQYAQSCAVTDTEYEAQARLTLGDFTSSAAGGTWYLRGPNNLLLGKVTCPCPKKQGETLTEYQAEKIIIGQVAAIGLPQFIAEKMQSHHIAGAKWNSKVAISVLAMLKCWKQNCAAAEEEHLLQNNSTAQSDGLLGLLAETSTSASGTGWNCG